MCVCMCMAPKDAAPTKSQREKSQSVGAKNKVGASLVVFGGRKQSQRTNFAGMFKQQVNAVSEAWRLDMSQEVCIYACICAYTSMRM